MFQKYYNYVLFLALISIPTISARCLNWCSKNGICTDPGEAGYCQCNIGYTGADCAKKICPKAYDTLTIGSNTSRRALRLTIGRESGDLRGKLKLKFHDDVVTMESSPSMIYTDDCTKSFTSFQGISKATCQPEQEWSAEAMSYSYLITINEWSLIPHENNLFFHSGNPDLMEFQCDVSLLDDSQIIKPYCEFTDVVDSNLPEYLECGHHGKCDFKTGNCNCQHGFHGEACHDTSDGQDEFAAVHDGPFFTGSVIKGLAIRDPSKGFNLLELGYSRDIFQSNTTVTRIRGDGFLEHTGDAEFHGQLSISTSLQNREKKNTLLSLAYHLPKNQMNCESCEQNTMIESTAISPNDFHVQLHTITANLLPNQEEPSYHTRNVLNITGAGDIQTTGNLNVGFDKFTVIDGVVTAQSLNVQTSLDVHGSAVIEDSLTIGSGFALTPEGMTIDTARHTGPLLELRSSQRSFEGAYLEINTLTGAAPRGVVNSSMIRTTVDGLTTFDLKSDGHLVVSGLQMRSGGLVVSSGGALVESGGLKVHGGITLESGQFNLKDHEMKLSNLILENENTQSPLLVMNNSHSHYLGPLISINDHNSNGRNYLILESTKDRSPTFQLDREGNIVSSGSMHLQNKLVLNSDVNVNGLISFTPHQIKADDEILIPSNYTFVEILNDNKNRANVAYLPMIGDKGTALTPGQVLILRNLDTSPLYLSSRNQNNHQDKTLKLQSDVTILLIFNGYDWIDIQSLSTSITKLKDIQELNFVNDVYVGNISITSGGYRMNGLNKGEILVGGIGGSIKGRKGLTYSNGILSTQGLKVQSLESDVDGNFKTISNAILTQPILLNASITASSITIPKATGVAYFTHKGELKSSNSIHLTEEGHLQITDIYHTVNLHNNSLQNISSLSCDHLTNIKTATIHNLYLKLEEKSNPSGDYLLSRRRSDGLIQNSPVKINSETNEIFINNLHLQNQMSDVNYHHHQIINSTIVRGDIKEMSFISTHSLQLLSPTSTSSSASSKVVKSLSVIDKNGILSADTEENQIPIRGSNLEIQKLNILSTHSPVTEKMTILGTTTDRIVSGKDLFYSNGELHTPSITTEKLDTSELFLTGIHSPQPSSLLSIDSKGKVTSTSTGKLDDLQTHTLSVSGGSKLGNDVQLTGLSNTVLSVNEQGRIISGNDAKFNSITSRKGIFETIILDKGSGSGNAGGLLVTNTNGEVSSSNSVSINSLEAKTILSNNLSTNEMYLKTLLSASFLSTNSEGKLQASKDFIGESIHVQQGVVKDLRIEKLVMSSFEPNTFLTTNSKGEMTSTQNGKLNSLEVENVQISDKLIVKSLQLNDPLIAANTNKNKNKNMKTNNLLVVDEKGNVISTDSGDIAMNSLFVDKNVVIEGEIAIKSLKFLMGNENKDKETMSGDQLLKVSSDGQIQAISKLVVSSLESKTDLVSDVGKFQTLELRNLPANQPLIVTDSGQVSTSSELVINSIKTQTIESSRGKFDELILKLPSSSSSSSSSSVASTTTTSGYLKIDSNGLVHSTNKIETVSVMVNDQLNVHGDTHLKSLFFSSPDQNLDKTKNYFLQIDSETGQVKFNSDLHTSSLSSESIEVGEIETRQLKIKSKVNQSSILMITPTGLVTSVDSNPDSSTQFSISKLKIGEAEISNLSLNVEELRSESNELNEEGFLTVSSTGQLILSKKSSMNHLKSDAIHVKNLHLSEKLHFTSEILKDLKSESKKRATILSMNFDTNELSLQPNVEISSLESKEIITSSLTTTTLQLPFLGDSLLGTKSDGTIVKSEEIVGKLKSLETKSIHTDTLETKSIKLNDLVPMERSQILGVNTDGMIEMISELTIPKISTEHLEVSKNLKSESMTLTNTNPGILQIKDKGGEITTTNSLTIDDMKVKNLEVISSLKVSDLILLGLPSSSSSSAFSSSTSTSTLNAGGGFLTIDSKGKVTSTSTGKLDDLQTHTLSVSGGSKLGNDVQLTGLSNTVLSVNEQGRIISGNDAKLGDIQTKSLINKGKLQTSELEVQSLSSEGVVVSKSDGKVFSTNEIKLSSLQTNSLQVNSDSQMNSLTVKSLRLGNVETTSRNADEMLFIDPSGKVSSRSVLNQVVINEGKVNDLTVTNKVISKSFQFQLSDSSPLMDQSIVTSNRNGVLQLSNEIDVKSMRVEKKLTVSEELETNSLKLKTLKPLTFITSDSTGYLVSNNQISVSEGVVRMSDVIVENIKDDVNFNQKKILNSVISKSQIMNSDIFITSDQKRGFEESSLAIIDQDSGLLGQSSKITVTKSGSLKLGSIHPLIQDGYIQIHSAELHSPHLIQARVDAKEIKTTTLIVTGTSDMNGDVYVDGSVNVRGSVIGSGPYIDTSDARFKTNITHIENALDIVTKLNGVTYDNRCDEFPSYNFPDNRQMGWIADELVDLVPELVLIDSEGFKHVSYSRSVALLGEAIKELSLEWKRKEKEFEERLRIQEEEMKELKGLVKDLLKELRGESKNE